FLTLGCIIANNTLSKPNLSEAEIPHMTRRHFFGFAATVAVVALVVLTSAAPLPMRLTDQEFWKLSADASEPSGTFHSENLVSNEIRFQTIVPSLIKT